ncbi:DUF6943 family protein [Pontibacter qinzhouensis]|uniref:DUF6943 family protein n=1 Tax=Pontibacter qinzhouensis TaxID=2603253 RepID=UPI003F6FBEFF
MVEIRTNFEGADFYIKRRGSIGNLGKPTDEYSPEAFGVRVNQTVLVPRYLYYVILHLHQQKAFEPYAKGTLSLKHITLKDLQEVIYNGLVRMNQKRT